VDTVIALIKVAIPAKKKEIKVAILCYPILGGAGL